MMAPFSHRTLPAQLGIATFGIVNVAFLAMSAAALAQLPTTELTTIYPPGGQRGNVATVQIAGANLDEARQLMFSHPGITARLRMRPPTEFETEPQAIQGSFEVKVGDDVPVGIYEVRAVGRFGASNPRSFAVSDVREVPDNDKNSAVAEAQSVEIPVLVNGRLGATGSDHYRVRLARGQTIVIDCATRRIDSRCEAVLVVLDAEDHELLHARSHLEQDTRAAFAAPSDGEYIVAVRDAIYRSGSEYFYRLQIDSRPHIGFVFPPAGQPGVTQNYTIYGYNLPDSRSAETPDRNGQPLQRMERAVALPEAFMPIAEHRSHYVPARATVLRGFPLRIEHSHAVPIYETSTPIETEQESNDEAKNAQRIEIPTEYVGQFYPARDRDWIEFNVARGEKITVEVLSSRLGLLTDPSLLIERVRRAEDGEQIVETKRVDDPAERDRNIGNDFDLSSDDPIHSFTADSDSTYRIMIRDNFGGTRNDLSAVYRLHIRRSRPDFAVVAVPLAFKTANKNEVPQWSPVLRRGGTTMIPALIVRRDGFDGPIQLSAEDLPSGVACPPVQVSGSGSSASLIFAADAEAPASSTPIRIVGRASIGGQDIAHTASVGTLVWGSSNKQQQPASFRAAGDIVLSVIDAETSPVTVLPEPKEGGWEASVGDMLAIPFHIQRRDDFRDKVILAPVGLPKEFEAQDIAVDGDTEKVVLTFAAAKEGVYSLYLQGEAKIRYERNPAAIAQAEHEYARLKQLVADLKQASRPGDHNTSSPEELGKWNAKIKRAEAFLKAAESHAANVKKANAVQELTIPILSTPVQIRLVSSK